METVRRLLLYGQIQPEDQCAGTEEIKYIEQNRDIEKIRGIEQIRDIEKLTDRNSLIDYVIKEVRLFFESLTENKIKRVINGTGVVLHTNMGRAPMGRQMLRETADALAGYCSVEYDIFSGKRTERSRTVSDLLRVLTDAQDCLVVNNNAAAVMLALSAVSAGLEVIVSRGELVEIGGGFRIPDVITYGGAVLREAGTTNRTEIRDYEEAVCENTGAVLKVNKSNFVMQGFVRETDVCELSELCRAKKIPLIYDLGSGCLLPGQSGRLFGEPSVAEAIKAGADLVCFSADKLLGGPQAGVIAGRAQLIDRLRRHPLYRALRPGKTTLILLSSCLKQYLKAGSHQEGVFESLIMEMLCQSPSVLEERAKRLENEIINRLSAEQEKICEIKTVRTAAFAGGGTLPQQPFESRALAVRPVLIKAEVLAERLRSLPVPVIARVEDDTVYVDIIAVEPEMEKVLAVQLGDRALYGAVLRDEEAEI